MRTNALSKLRTVGSQTELNFSPLLLLRPQQQFPQFRSGSVISRLAYYSHY